MSERVCAEDADGKREVELEETLEPGPNFLFTLHVVPGMPLECAVVHEHVPVKDRERTEVLILETMNGLRHKRVPARKMENRAPLLADDLSESSVDV